MTKEEWNEIGDGIDKLDHLDNINFWERTAELIVQDEDAWEMDKETLKKRISEERELLNYIHLMRSG